MKTSFCCIASSRQLSLSYIVSGERYEYAKKLKSAVIQLQTVGLALGKLEMEKRAAIDMENYDKAKLTIESMNKTSSFSLTLGLMLIPYANGATLFTKLDVKEADWHIRLDEESSKLKNYDHSLRQAPMATSPIWTKGQQRDFPAEDHRGTSWSEQHYKCR